MREERDMGAGAKAKKAKLAALAIAALAAALALLPAAAGAEVPELLASVPEEAESGSGANQLQGPAGIAADPNLPGNVYVADQNNNRIDVFSPWGEFLYAFGWGVVASGPDDKPQDEIQEVAVDATAGSFTLTYVSPFRQANGYHPSVPSGAIAFDASAAAVREALEEAPYLAVVGVSVSGPAGGPWTVELGGDTDFRLPTVNSKESTLSGGTGVSVHTIQDGANFETCVPAKGDTCREGQWDRGAHAGQMLSPEAVAVGPEGDVYVAEGYNQSTIAERASRIEKFGPEGEFLAAFGDDTVAHGPDDSSNDEVQQLSVAASEGSFRLGFANPWRVSTDKSDYFIPERGETAPLPYDASAAEVEAALNALPTIGGLGGSVKVTGGPGDATGSSPYEVAFEGNLGGDDVPRLEIDRSELGAAAIGGTLRCSTTTEAEEIEYRWLRNGEEIPGAESPTYTTVAADEGKSVQCQIRVVSGEGGRIQATTPVYVAPPEGGTPPPLAPKLVSKGNIGGFYAYPETGELKVGSGGGQRLICEPGSWSDASSFAYGWYRNGVRIPGATESTYAVTEADLASPANFQCKVTASNAGTATTTEFSPRDLQGKGVTRPGPSPGLEFGFRSELSMDPPSNVHTLNQGGGPEVCGPADTCKAGTTRRAEGSLGDPGYGGRLAVSPVDGAVFLGETKRERAGEPSWVQVFESDGAYREAIEFPYEESTNLSALAADGGGNLYAGLVNGDESKVRKLEPSGPSAGFLSPTFAVPKTDGTNLNGITVDADGNVYADVNGQTPRSPEEPGVDRGSRVIEFDAAGSCLDCGTDGEGGEPGFDRDPEAQNFTVKRERFTYGIAAGGACGSIDTYIAHGVVIRSPAFSSSSFYSIFGPPPDPALCPPPEAAPTIADQWASAVGTEDAVLRAKINPHYWPDTRYHLEYGAAPCSEGGCRAQPAAPGRALSTKVVNARLTTTGVVLTGLQPGTTYHYRFVAQSGGGGPVRGRGGTPGEDGAEGTFTTFAPEAPASDCPNQALRNGPAALLPDCRAYEMVSPVEKEGGDVLPPIEGFLEVQAALEQSSAPGPGEPQRLVYGSYRAFGDAESGAWTSQYLATRTGEGWQSENITPPRDRLNTTVVLTDTELKALSPDLCHSWWRTAASPQLAPAAVPNEPNIYRRDEARCGSGEGSWEAFTTLAPPGRLGWLELQGTSADGNAAVYATWDSLATPAPQPPAQPEGCEITLSGCRPELYYQEGGEGPPRFVCVLPDAAPTAGGCSAGTGNTIYNNRKNSLWHAISADGSRVYWTAAAHSTGAGAIYLRENPGAPESAHLHGTAAGRGDLIGPASGAGTLFKFSKTVTEVSGEGFVAGQAIAGAGIPSGTTIAEFNPETGIIKLSKAATANGAEIELTGEASATVSHVVTESGALAVGQEISAANGGIPPGTTIAAVEGPSEGLYTITLSAKATKTAAEAGLSATSPCTEAARACTLPVSGEAEALEGSEESTYQWGAKDGSRALFSTSNALYEYDLGEGEAHRVAGKFLSLMGGSEDASRVYFASGEVLAGENPQGEAPAEGQANLYLYDANLPEGERFRFVAGIPQVDVSSALSPVSADKPVFNAARVSPDGLRAAFTTHASPKTAAHPGGYDNTDVVSGEADTEVYRYDAAANGGEGQLVCASCNPSGARPAGAGLERGGRVNWVAAWLPTWVDDLYASRALSADGSRLFFTAADALSPHDSNGVADVYEWEAAGSGSCEEGNPDYRAANGGCVDLISSGHGSDGSRFVDANPTGHDVFIATAQSLDPADPGLLDIYDARVGGGFPPPPAKPAACEGEACQGAPEAPDDPTPASESFEGAGNVSEEAQPEPARSRCPKGKVKRKGRCVAKKHHRKKHRKKHKRRARHDRRAGR